MRKSWFPSPFFLLCLKAVWSQTSLVSVKSLSSWQPLIDLTGRGWWWWKRGGEENRSTKTYNGQSVGETFPAIYTAERERLLTILYISYWLIGIKPCMQQSGPYTALSWEWCMPNWWWFRCCISALCQHLTRSKGQRQWQTLKIACGSSMVANAIPSRFAQETKMDTNDFHAWSKG